MHCEMRIGIRNVKQIITKIVIYIYTYKISNAKKRIFFYIWRVFISTPSNYL